MTHMYCSLNSLIKGGYIGDYIGTAIGFIKGDTRSSDSVSYGSGVGLGSFQKVGTPQENPLGLSSHVALGPNLGIADGKAGWCGRF